MVEGRRRRLIPRYLQTLGPLVLLVKRFVVVVTTQYQPGFWATTTLLDDIIIV